MTAGLPLAIWALILIYSLCVLVSHGCCNNLPQIWWLKTRQLSLLQFWRSEARNQFRWAAVKVWQGCVLRGYLPPAFPGLQPLLSLSSRPFLHPQAFCGPAALCLWHTAFFPMASLPVLPCYKDTCDCIHSPLG